MEAIKLMSKITKQSRQLLLVMALYKGKINPDGYLEILDMNYQSIYYKYLLLQQYGIMSHITYINDTYYLRTKKYKFIRLYYKIALKKFTIKLLKRLRLIDLAILYHDIGSIYYKKKNNKIHAISLVLYTKLSKNKNQQFIDIIKQKWNIQFYQLKDKQWYKLCCNTTMTKKFLSLIKPYNFIER